MVLTIYYTSVSGSREVKQQQQAIFQYLDSMKIKYNLIDIAASNDLKEEMYRKTGKTEKMPPQIFNGDIYCGDYSMFFEAVEDMKVKEFFQIK
ncbi:SH3 domain-binding glutamic acid-rich-like protein 3 [Acipenser oxyrinchus oxyrinchus]|uniref:SH3 domain-binding glutamic acid-rich-like protein 3 n=1 Tax=Acipenser oxyrinchus oxyrinchus TaxID=40147 RepID=A0AAD8GAJ2_ACIOX|nr:SH3 domain-binding glutamic acid-rich-like protein 3 [Acipenser oxyrinchus oxyrinchus]